MKTWTEKGRLISTGTEQGQAEISVLESKKIGSRSTEISFKNALIILKREIQPGPPFLRILLLCG